MLRPKRMSRVSITGSKQTLEDVIEAIHDLQLVHLIEYDGSWNGFDPGDPIQGADEAASDLVTVRSIQSILDVPAEELDTVPEVSSEEIETQLPGIREQVTTLDDRRRDLRDDIREISDKIETVEPFTDFPVSLDLLSGYENLEVVVGDGDMEAVSQALDEADEVEAFDVMGSDSLFSVFVYPKEVDIDDLLVGVNFTAQEIPEATGTASESIEKLEAESTEREAELRGVEEELEELRRDYSGFLIAAEEKLAIDVQKREAPLTFATTENAFIAEGWLPTEKIDVLDSHLEGSVGEHVDVEELERAKYDSDGHPHGHEEIDETSTGEQVATDGSGHAERVDGDLAMSTDNPPVIQDNPKVSEPFQLLVNTINRPRYSEVDPTLIVFLTFPFAFGFMIGDMGYGLLYMLMGWALYRVNNAAIKSLGIIAVWSGAFTFLFGYLYDDFFGIHVADLGIHFPLAGTLNKGLHVEEFALLWVAVSVLFGILHLSVGYILGFINDLNHGVKEAALENISWFLALNGFFVWVFSVHLQDNKPEFILGSDSVLATFTGFAGFPEPVGLAGLAVAGVGVVMLFAGEGGVGLVELPSILANSLSYLRIVAVLLAKGGMAFAVNLLVFGAYADHGHVVFNLPTNDVTGYEQQFVGLIHIDPLIVGLPLAILVFVLGHILVLLLGITAAGIQMVRLEYVEFFGKFYEGGGSKYQPFGQQRTSTNS